MKVVYLEPPTQEWRATLTPWQLQQLVDLHRQGKHLPEKTNHGSDYRWSQAGCRTGERVYRGRPVGIRWRRNHRSDGHEMVAIQRQPFGYTIIFLRRARVWLLADDLHTVTEMEGWQPVRSWHVGAGRSANMVHLLDREGRT